PDAPDGTLSLDALGAELRKGGVRLVSLNHIPTHNGHVNPAAGVGRRCREHGVLYLLDACQSVGQLAVDVREISCDMLSATGRKFLRGPRGTGFLYVRREVVTTLEPPFLDLQAAEWKAPDGYEPRADARRVETWERYVAGQIGLGVAADYAADLGTARIEERVTRLAARLRAALAERPGTTVLDRGARPSGIVTFTVDGHDPGEIKKAAREAGVNVNVTNPAGHGYDPRAVPAAVRASVHYYNTEEELDRLLSALPNRGRAAGKGAPGGRDGQWRSRRTRPATVSADTGSADTGSADTRSADQAFGRAALMSASAETSSFSIARS